MPVSCVMLQREELIIMSSNWKNHQLQFLNGSKLDMTLVITLSSCSVGEDFQTYTISSDTLVVSIKKRKNLYN